MIIKSSIRVLIASDSDIDKEFTPMHQSVMSKKKNNACED